MYVPCHTCHPLTKSPDSTNGNLPDLSLCCNTLKSIPKCKATWVQCDTFNWHSFLCRNGGHVQDHQQNCQRHCQIEEGHNVMVLLCQHTTTDGDRQRERGRGGRKQGWRVEKGRTSVSHLVKIYTNCWNPFRSVSGSAGHCHNAC